MLTNRLPFPPVKTILCLGAHSDDIEIGCGGTILTLAARCPDAAIHWVVFSANGARHDEALHSAEAFTSRFATRAIELRDFRDGFFPYGGPAVKESFEQLKKSVQPDLILTHFGRDLHQDHRAVSELTWNTWRDHLVLEYEIAKYDGDLGAPNVFVPLDADKLEAKIEFLMKFFETQSRKQWFDPVAFRGLARIRGIECNSPTGFAEAFFGRKITLA